MHRISTIDDIKPKLRIDNGYWLFSREETSLFPLNDTSLNHSLFMDILKTRIDEALSAS